MEQLMDGLMEHWVTLWEFIVDHMTYGQSDSENVLHD